MIPGPGAYTNKSITGTEGPKYSIPTVKPAVKYNEAPGPGSYEPQPVVSSDPRPVIGKEKRTNSSKEELVGPGHYNPYSETNKGKGFT